jgi:hypothetical protein
LAYPESQVTRTQSLTTSVVRLFLFLLKVLAEKLAEQERLKKLLGE